MSDSVVSIMEKNIIIANLDDTVEHIVEKLDSHRLSCVPIVESNGRCFGVISAADFIHFYNTHKNLRATQAWEICTHKIIEVSPDISIQEASNLMLKNKIHHLVVTESNTIKGVLSSIDLLRECLANKNCI